MYCQQVDPSPEATLSRLVKTQGLDPARTEREIQVCAATFERFREELGLPEGSNSLPDISVRAAIAFSDELAHLIEKDEFDIEDHDLIFLGGGSDYAQNILYKHLLSKKDKLEKVLETMLPHAGEKTIQFMIKYSLGGMLYLWWRPANLILSYLYDDEVEEVKAKKKTYTRREILQLAFLPILR